MQRLLPSCRIAKGPLTKGTFGQRAIVWWSKKGCVAGGATNKGELVIVIKYSKNIGKPSGVRCEPKYKVWEPVSKKWWLGVCYTYKEG